MTLLLKCSGFEISDYTIPKFTISQNSFVRIRIPFILESKSDRELLSLLLNEKFHKSISFGDFSPIYSGKIHRNRKNIFDIFKSDKILDVLNRYYKKDKKEISELLFSMNIKINSNWKKIPLLDKYILSFETASICSSFVFFDTTGLDPIGIERMCDCAIQKCKKGHTVVHLLYPTLSDDLFDKECEFVELRR